MSIVDTHCHVDLGQFDEDRHGVIQNALAAAVHAQILIGYNPERWRTTAQMCAEFPFMRRAVGLHPNDAGQWSDELQQALVNEVASTRPIAIGEIGLDFYRSEDNVEQQSRAFIAQVTLAEREKLPIIIHQRSAEHQVLEILEAFGPLRGVMHCFTGDADFARRCVDLGMHLGIGGVLTYPRSDDVRAAVASVPLDRLLLETDAPFLAPQFRRGKRNEPAYLSNIVECLADVRAMSIDAVIAQTTRNAIDLFGPSLADAVRSGMENS